MDSCKVADPCAEMADWIAGKKLNKLTDDVRNQIASGCVNLCR